MEKDFETLLKQHRQKHFQELMKKVEGINTSDEHKIENIVLLTFNEAIDAHYSLISTYHSWLTENFELVPKKHD